MEIGVLDAAGDTYSPPLKVDSEEQTTTASSQRLELVNLIIYTWFFFHPITYKFKFPTVSCSTYVYRNDRD